MAATLGHEADALEFLVRLAEAPYRHDFYQTLRRLECLAASKPRWGHARRPIDEPVRLGQDPELSFAPASLSSFRQSSGGRPARLQVRLFGLLGPNGPLPTHFTEYTRDRLHHANDPTLARFLDLLQHRFIALFYRAWAQAQPHVNRDRPADDRFTVYIGAFAGTAHRRLRGRDRLPDVAALFHAGTLIRPSRNAEGLRAILCQFFRVPVRLQEFVGHWMRLGPQERSRLGAAGATLGRGAVAGGRVWDRQNSFRVHLGPLTLDQYEAFLPGGTLLPRLVAWVRLYRNLDLAWDVRLRLDRKHVPALRLGRAGRLGWTTWLGQRRVDEDPDDLCLDAEAFVTRNQSSGVGVPGEYQTL
jgi:type VI secretion system protein ImpH